MTNRLFAVLAVALLALGACGSDDDNETSTDATTTTAANTGGTDDSDDGDSDDGDSSTDLDACSSGQLPSALSYAVTSDGAVWWDIGTQQLATGGWVNSTFLEEARKGGGE